MNKHTSIAHFLLAASSPNMPPLGRAAIVATSWLYTWQGGNCHSMLSLHGEPLNLPNLKRPQSLNFKLAFNTLGHPGPEHPELLSWWHILGLMSKSERCRYQSQCKQTHQDMQHDRRGGKGCTTRWRVSSDRSAAGQVYSYLIAISVSSLPHYSSGTMGIPGLPSP